MKGKGCNGDKTERERGEHEGETNGGRVKEEMGRGSKGKAESIGVGRWRKGEGRNRRAVEGVSGVHWGEEDGGRVME